INSFTNRILRLAAGSLLVLTAVVSTRAQDEARAAWQVQRYDITVTAVDRNATVSAVVSVKNIGQAAGTTVTFRFTKSAEVTGAKVSGAVTDFRTGEEPRGGLQRITVTVPSTGPNAQLQVTLEYKLNIATNSGIAAVSPVNTQFLPSSMWFPMTATPYSSRGVEAVPFKLTVSTGGQSVISSGKSVGSTFDQPNAGLPFFATGNWDVIDGTAAAAGISALIPKGANPNERSQAEALIATAAAARSFFSGSLGPAPDLPLRLVSVSRGGGFSDGGTTLLDAAAFRRSTIDSITANQIAEGVVRSWLGSARPIRGDGAGVIREGLVHFLASLFLEKQFGREATDSLRQRERLAYVSVVKRDAPLSLTTPLEDTYYNSVTNKGSMVWRLVDQVLSRDVFLGIVKALAQSGRDSGEGITLAGLRAALAERGGAAFKTLLDQELDQPTDLDLLVGLPALRGGNWVSALRNMGSFEVTTNVTATTATGEKVTVRAVVPPRDFGEAVFKTTGKIVRVEVDPEKVYPQLDYSNDLVPRGRVTDSALAEAKSAFDRGDFAKAEGIARDVLTVYPFDEDARLRLGRSLLGQNKLGEAEKELKALLDGKMPSPITLGWANSEMGEINLRRNQAGPAARFFDEAVRSGGDYGATLAARAGRIKAESSGGTPPADDAAKTFFANFDKTLVTGRRAEIEALVVSSELARFISGVTINQPQVWQTRVLRSESLDANRMAVDVALTIRQLDKDAAGTAVLVLARVGGAWKLEDIQFFEVH
ncbi:MAG: hypothetical protein ABIP75_15180, partial [Pyrinomonadaceae bacterium]